MVTSAVGFLNRTLLGSVSVVTGMADILTRGSAQGKFARLRKRRVGCQAETRSGNLKFESQRARRKII